MDWYRVTFARAGKKLKPVELPAHNTTDAVSCALVKAGLHSSDPDEVGEVELVDLDCIPDPEHAKATHRLRQSAIRGFTELTEQIGRLVQARDGAPESKDPTPEDKP